MRSLFFLFTVTSVSLAIPPYNPTAAKEAATQILSFLQPKANPCDDFYEFACGKWTLPKLEPYKKDNTRLYEYLEQKVNKDVEELLTDKKVYTSKALNKLKQYYAACKETEKLKGVGGKSVQKEIENIGVWPLFNGVKFNPATFDLTDLLVKTNLGDASSPPLLGVRVASDLVLDLDTPVNDLYSYFGGDQNNSAQDKQDRLKALNRILEGLPYDKKVADKDLDDLVALDKRLFAASTAGDNVERTKVDGYEALGRLLPAVNWERYFRGVVPTEVLPNLRKTTEIWVNQATAKKLNEVIKSTPPRVLANYIIFDYLIANIIDDPEFINEHCPYNVIVSTNYHATSSLFARRFFDNDIKSQANEIAENVKTAFIEALQSEKRLEKPKQDALGSIKGLHTRFGFAEFSLNDAELDKYYDGWKVEPGAGYAEIKRNLNIWNQRRLFAQLVKEEVGYPPDALTRSANYNNYTGLLEIPVSVLQFPYFTKNFPSAVNFGTLGSLLADAVRHGFETLLAAGSTPGRRRGKRFAINEVYGDESTYGIEEALAAYRNYVKKNGEEKRLPGLEKYSNEQILLTAFAQMGCANLVGSAESYSKESAYNTGKYTANVYLSYFPEFAKIFSCPKGARMNREKKTTKVKWALPGYEGEIVDPYN